MCCPKILKFSTSEQHMFNGFVWVVTKGTMGWPFRVESIQMIVKRCVLGTKSENSSLIFSFQFS